MAQPQPPSHISSSHISRQQSTHRKQPRQHCSADPRTGGRTRTATCSTPTRTRSAPTPARPGPDHRCGARGVSVPRRRAGRVTPISVRRSGASERTVSVSRSGYHARVSKGIYSLSPRRPSSSRWTPWMSFRTCRRKNGATARWTSWSGRSIGDEARRLKPSRWA